MNLHALLFIIFLKTILLLKFFLFISPELANKINLIQKLT